MRTGDQGRRAGNGREKRESEVPGTRREHRTARGRARQEVLPRSGHPSATWRSRGTVPGADGTTAGPGRGREGGARRAGGASADNPPPASCRPVRPVRSGGQGSLARTQAPLSALVYVAASLRRAHRALSPSPREVASASLQGSREMLSTGLAVLFARERGFQRHHDRAPCAVSSESCRSSRPVTERKQTVFNCLLDKYD